LDDRIASESKVQNKVISNFSKVVNKIKKQNKKFTLCRLKIFKL